MDIILSFITVMHVVVSVILVVIVLLQPGKGGGDLGSVFGGSTQTLFGAGGAVPFLTKMTRFLGIVFFATSLSLGYFLVGGKSSSVVSDVPFEPFTEQQMVDTPAPGTAEDTGGEEQPGITGTLVKPGAPGDSMAPAEPAEGKN